MGGVPEEGEEEGEREGGHGDVLGGTGLSSDSDDGGDSAVRGYPWSAMGVMPFPIVSVGLFALFRPRHTYGDLTNLFGWYLSLWARSSTDGKRGQAAPRAARLLPS